MKPVHSTRDHERQNASAEIADLEGALAQAKGLDGIHEDVENATEKLKGLKQEKRKGLLQKQALHRRQCQALLLSARSHQFRRSPMSMAVRWSLRTRARALRCPSDCRRCGGTVMEMTQTRGEGRLKIGGTLRPRILETDASKDVASNGATW